MHSLQKTAIVLNINSGCDFFSFITDTNLAPCEQKIEDVKGVIKTAKSGAISDCTWLITVPAGHNIFLKFTTLELYFKNDENPWEKFWGKTELQVWDGHNESSASLGVYRGTKRAFSLQSSSRYLFIRLRVFPDTVLCNVQGLFFASTVIGKSDFGLNLAWSGLNPDTLFVLTFASFSFSLSFKFARFNFAHLVKTYSRSFKFAEVIFRVCSF